MASVNDNITLIQGAGLVMQDLYKEVTGAQNLSALPSGDYVSVANATFKYGTDAVVQGLARVLTRTVFSARPYNAKLSFLQVDTTTWGGMIRKLHPIDDPAFIDSKTMPLTQGSSIDPYTIHKHPTFQMFVTGEYRFARVLTKFIDQLEACFFNAAEFGSFLGMIITEVTNEIAVADEGVARMTLANFVIGNYLSDNAGDSVEAGHRVIHAITAYNTFYGYASTDPGYIANVATASKTPEFWKWLYTKVKHELEFMAERTQFYHVKLSGMDISKHTTPENRKILVNSEMHEFFNVFAKAGTYHDDYLKIGDGVEDVAFWQNPKAPLSMSSIATYLKADGTLKEESTATTLQNIAMVVFDKDAMAITKKKAKVEAIHNPAGQYDNLWYNWEYATMNDFCENAFIVCLD